MEDDEGPTSYSPDDPDAYPSQEEKPRKTNYREKLGGVYSKAKGVYSTYAPRVASGVKTGSTMLWNKIDSMKKSRSSKSPRKSSRRVGSRSPPSSESPLGGLDLFGGKGGSSGMPNWAKGNSGFSSPLMGNPFGSPKRRKKGRKGGGSGLWWAKI